MPEPMENSCLVGLVHCMAYPEVSKGEGPILETLSKVVRDDFFGAVEVGWIREPSVRAEAARLLEAGKMEVIFSGQVPLLAGRLSLCAEDQGERERAILECKRSVDQAYQLGARMMPVVSGPDPGEEGREAARERLVDSLKQVCAYAQEKGETHILAICLENFDREVDKRFLIGPTREAVQVAEAVKAQYTNFGLTIDLSHLPLLGEDPHEALLLASDHIIHAHIGNCVLKEGHPAYGDQHPPFGTPGGMVEVEEVRVFLEALIYSGYLRKSLPTSMPVISFEVRPLPGQDSDAVVAGAKRTLRQAWARLGGWEPGRRGV